MKDKLKALILNNLTDTDLRIERTRNFKILAMTCFWSKKNFSAIIKFYGQEYYCYFDNALNEIIIECNLKYILRK